MNEKYPLALPAGTVLAGQYIVEKVLGQGGFGITYEAVDHKTSQKVAVKEFFPDAMATRTGTTAVLPFSGERGESYEYGKNCFLQEAETLAQFIGNENIVRIHSYFEENGTAYFVMDFVEGTSFDEYLKQRGGKISYEEAIRILVPVMDALSAVHSRGIVHRDVTPDNIYITKEGVVKLLDFGAARYSLGDKSRSLDIVLKHGFAPKEQYTRRGRQGPYTDIYALGATFYFALTGRRPQDSIERMDEDELVPPRALGVQIGKAAEDALLIALNVQPGDRFQSMMAFKNALLSCRELEEPVPVPVAADPVSVGGQRYFTAPEQNMVQSQVPVQSQTPVQEVGSSQGQYQSQAPVPSQTPVQNQTPVQEVGSSQGQYQSQAPVPSQTPVQNQVPVQEVGSSQGQMTSQGQPQSQTPVTQVGSTVQDAVPVSGQGTPEDTSTAQKAAGKKKLYIGIGGAAAVLVACIGIFLAVRGGKDAEPASASRDYAAADSDDWSEAGQETDSWDIPADFSFPPAQTDTPESVPSESAPEETATPAPTSAPSGNLQVLGNSASNNMNGGHVSIWNNSIYWIDNSGHWLGSTDRTLYENTDGTFSDLSIVGDELYFLYDRSAYVYNLQSGTGANYAPYLEDYYGGLDCLMLTEDYYVVCYWDGSTYTVYRVSRANGETVQLCNVGEVHEYTLSSDGWIYYVNVDLDEKLSGVYRRKLDTLEDDGRILNFTQGSESWVFCNPIIVGDFLYVCSSNSADFHYYRIIRYNMVSNEVVTWDIGTRLGFLTRYGGFGFNVNPDNEDIYFAIWPVQENGESGYPNLYQVKGNADGSFDIGLVSEKAYAPNMIFYRNDGIYRVFYYKGITDDDGNFYYSMYYNDYDL